MSRLLLQRSLALLITSLAIIFATFWGMGLVVRADAPQPETSVIDTLIDAGGETGRFLGGLIRGQMDPVPTISGPQPVGDILWFAYKNSLGIMLLALTAAVCLGLFIGAVAALIKQARWVDLLLTLTIIGISAPSFIIAILLQQGGIRYTVTVGRMLVSMGGYGWDFQHLAMPLLVLAARPVAYLTRATYIGLTQVLTQDYIRTAYAKGLGRWRTVVGHGLRNLAVPVLTAVGVSLRFSLSTLPIVEYIFAWPGIGLRLLEAINDRVPLLVVVTALTLGVSIQLVNLMLDIAYRLVDPRLRERP